MGTDLISICTTCQSREEITDVTDQEREEARPEMSTATSAEELSERTRLSINSPLRIWSTRPRRKISRRLPLTRPQPHCQSSCSKSTTAFPALSTPDPSPLDLE